MTRIVRSYYVESETYNGPLQGRIGAIRRARGVALADTAGKPVRVRCIEGDGSYIKTTTLRTYRRMVGARGFLRCLAVEKTR